MTPAEPAASPELGDESTLDDHLASYARTGDRLATWCGGVEWTYAELDDQVSSFAGALVGAGLGTGDVVAVFGNSRPECLVAFLGCCRLGALYLGLNTKYTYRELTFVCDDSRPGLVYIVDDALMTDAQRATIREVVAELPAKTVVVGPERLGASVTPAAFFDAAPTAAVSGRSSARPCAIVYTSGSTGAPKGAILSEAGCVRSGRLSWKHWYGGDPAMRVVVQHPINHVGWLVCECVSAIVAGGALFFRERFDGGATLKLIEEHRLTMWLAFPSMLALAMQSPAWESCDLSSLRRIALGTAAQLELLKRFRERFGGVFCVSYGLTEAHGGATTVTDDDADLSQVANSIGRPVPGIETRVVGSDGSDVEPGAPGELYVRDSTVFLGYLHNPEATAETVDADEWLHTGDVVVVDEDGTMHMVGRKKEMFKSGGYNVYPSEIEGVIGEHGEVVHVAVVEAPDPLWESVGVAFVVPNDGETFDVERLVTYLRSRLANYKIPKRFVLVDELPQLANGKVDRVSLRERAKAEDHADRSAFASEGAPS